MEDVNIEMDEKDIGKLEHLQDKDKKISRWWGVETNKFSLK